MTEKCNPLALGYSLAILSALLMLILGVLGNLDVALKAVEIMQSFHVFFSLTIGGVIAGIIEAAIFSFVAGYLIAYLYNKFI